VLAVGGIITLVAVLIASYTEQTQTTELRQKWDEVYLATKDKTKLPERIAALEGVMPKIVGSPAHGFALMSLGNLYFEEATSPKYAHDERTDALNKATQIFKMLTETEPFRSNMTFKPMAIGALASAYEQDGKLDDAINLLDGDKKGVNDPDIVVHQMYKPLEAQTGRLYWLRSVKKAEAGQDPESDRKAARTHLTDSLRTSEGEAGSPAWKEEAEFIKALTDNPGQALPGGKAPPEKREADKKDEKKADEPKKDEPKKDGADAKKPEEKKDAAPAPTAPADKKADDKTKPADPKAEPKAEPKKDGSVKLPDSQEAPVDESAAVPTSASPSGHLTFSQIQKALKEGRPAICNCPRCQMANMPPAGARLAD